MKAKKILTGIAIVSVALFAGCKKDNFTEVPGLCPKVVSTSPANGATSVPLNTVIAVTFNELLNTATITQASFIITGASQLTGTFSFIGTTVFFTPTNPLLYNTTYTGRITTAVKDPMGNALQVDYVWTFSTGPLIVPTVVSTDPANNATGVFLNKTVTATFSVPMDALTINASSFIVKQGLNIIAGTVKYTDTTASFKPVTDLLPNTVYTGTITTGAKSLPGVPLAANYVWTFTTGTLIAPTVIATDPIDNATGVPLNKTLSATFSMLMDQTTINATTFTLKLGTTAVAGTVVYNGIIASFTPTAPLLPNSVYTGTITTGAKNLAGIPLANNYVWKFTTISTGVPLVIATDPANNATGVLLNKTVTATFNMPMDPLTINTSTFTLKQGATTITGLVTYAGTMASFTPSAPLVANTIYTATITTGAKSLTGVALAANYVWTFTTGASIAPFVISTDPTNNATGVLLNKVITADFSTTMDITTINTSSFTLKIGTASVAGAVTYAGIKASFTPSALLLSNTTYTATITTGAKNMAGVPLANNYVWSFTTKAAGGPIAPPLNSVARFGIISGVGVSNNAGFSEIHNMDVGISPGFRSSITGFPPAIVVNGGLYAADDPAPIPAMLIQAKLDLTNAYLFAEAATTPAPTTVAGDQGGKTLAPGIYKSTSTLLIQSGDLTLDAQGDVNAVWIFQVAAGFTTIGGAGGNVILSGGAQAKNVYWQVGSSATIGDYTAFKGNVLALTSITMNSHATLVGRILCINGAIVLTHTNIIDKP